VWQFILLYSVVHYLSGGTLAFQLSILLLPVLLLVVAWLLLRQYAGLGRVFLACIAAFMGVNLYDIASMAANQVWNRYSAVNPRDTSWWSAFGVEWTLMAITVGVYSLCLWLVARKAGRQT
jgi:hypothetical protein